MTNYPPGVTGRELAIAGPDWEGELDVICDNDGALLHVITHDVANLLHELSGSSGWGAGQDDLIARRLRRALTTQPPTSIEDVTCPFEGTVDAWSYGGTRRWTCPVCYFEHEEDGADEEDPDDARDRQIEQEWRHGQEDGWQ